MGENYNHTALKGCRVKSPRNPSLQFVNKISLYASYQTELRESKKKTVTIVKELAVESLIVSSYGANT